MATDSVLSQHPHVSMKIS